LEEEEEDEPVAAPVVSRLPDFGLRNALAPDGFVLPSLALE
jgi:hypothetical protein